MVSVVFEGPDGGPPPDIEEASALIALEAANLLAGINDEQFRLNVRRRVADRLAQMPTISAA